uniref:Uncharacterized protein n=1 Tax=Rhizophora mucronata TaxID=61149 RepID=A0A2P2P2J1_RHIMU
MYKLTEVSFSCVLCFIVGRVLLWSHRTFTFVFPLWILAWTLF